VTILKHLHNYIHYLIASVWLINGLFCKVLNLVPRHQDIVAKILGEEHARVLTFSIGISEIIMSIWILSKILPKLNALTQIIIVLSMNILEQILAPELLLWGRLNLIYALIFCVIIYVNTFVLTSKTNSIDGLS